MLASFHDIRIQNVHDVIERFFIALRPKLEDCNATLCNIRRTAAIVYDLQLNLCCIIIIITIYGRSPSNFYRLHCIQLD